MDNASAFDLTDFLPYLLNQAAEESGLAFQKVYKDRYGMLRTEWRVLFHLGRYGDMTAREICQRARLHKTKVSRAVASLERRKYLTRTEMKHDRRHEQLAITKAGQRVFDDLCAFARAYDTRLVQQFSEAERDTLRRCLRRLSGLEREGEG